MDLYKYFIIIQLQSILYRGMESTTHDLKVMGL